MLRQQELMLPHHIAIRLARSAVDASNEGYYENSAEEKVDWSRAVSSACDGKRSIGPDVPLPPAEPAKFADTRVQVVNETTLAAAHRLVRNGMRPLALNFVNGVSPGGGFLHGALPSVVVGTRPVNRQQEIQFQMLAQVPHATCGQRDIVNSQFCENGTEKEARDRTGD